MVQIFKSIFPFNGMNVQDYFKNLSFCCYSTKYWRNLHFLNARNDIAITTSCVFITSDYVITVWYFPLDVLISELIQSESALNQLCSALKTQCFWAKKISAEQSWTRAEPLWTCPNSAKIIVDQLWKRADKGWCFSCSLNQRNVKSLNLWTALFSADYQWDSNPGVL